MRTFAILAAAAPLLLGALAKQGQEQTLPEPLATNFAKLSSTKSLTIDFTNRVVGETPLHYTLSLSKDKDFKLTYDGGYVICDGKTLTTYTKAKNTYTQEPLTDAVLGKFEKRPEMFGWAAFLQKTPSAEIESVRVGDSRTLKGHDVQAVNLTMKGGKPTGTLLIDKKLGIPWGYSVKVGDKEYLAIANTIEMGEEALPDSTFAFVAPEGAMLVEVQSGSSFSDVQTLLNDNCMPCHSARSRSAGVDLSNYQGVSASVTAGQPASSLLIKSVRGNGVTLMPKGRAPLSADQIKTLEKWITDGAKNE